MIRKAILNNNSDNVVRSSDDVVIFVLVCKETKILLLICLGVFFLSITRKTWWWKILSDVDGRYHWMSENKTYDLINFWPLINFCTGSGVLLHTWENVESFTDLFFVVSFGSFGSFGSFICFSSFLYENRHFHLLSVLSHLKNSLEIFL